MKTQQVAVAWRKVAFVVVSESPEQLQKETNAMDSGKGRERDHGTDLPSPLQSSDNPRGLV